MIVTEDILLLNRAILDSERPWTLEVVDDLPPVHNLDDKAPLTYLDTGYVYCPYIPITKEPQIVEAEVELKIESEEILPKSRSLLTRYGKKLLEEAKKHYGTITINGGKPDDTSHV